MANNAQLLLPSEIDPSCMDEFSRSGSGSLTFPEPYQKKVASGAAPNLAQNPEGFSPLAGHGSTSITRMAPPLPMPIPTTRSGGAGVCVFRPKLTNQGTSISISSRASPGPGMVPWHQNQVFPFGLAGACRGTGVFHPRPRLAPTGATNKTIRNKREIKNTKQEAKVTPQRNSSEVDGVLEEEEEEEENRQHLLSEMGLPNEWTY